MVNRKEWLRMDLERRARMEEDLLADYVAAEAGIAGIDREIGRLQAMEEDALANHDRPGAKKISPLINSLVREREIMENHAGLLASRLGNASRTISRAGEAMRIDDPSRIDPREALPLGRLPIPRISVGREREALPKQKKA